MGLKIHWFFMGKLWIFFFLKRHHPGEVFPRWGHVGGFATCQLAGYILRERTLKGHWSEHLLILLNHITTGWFLPTSSLNLWFVWESSLLHIFHFIRIGHIFWYPDTGWFAKVPRMISQEIRDMLLESRKQYISHRKAVKRAGRRFSH